VTRNWLSHGSSHMTILECLRAMQSLIDTLEIISPAVLPHVADADAALACIQSHITCVETALCAEVELSVELHACLVFMRALEQLRVCARSCLPPRAHDGDINIIIEEIPKSRPETPERLLCSMVLKGRNYMFHGANMSMTLPLLQSACAVSLLLRSLGAPAAVTEACDARAMQLMARIGISDVKSCVVQVVTSHSVT
jgi:hypothetical protein